MLERITIVKEIAKDMGATDKEISFLESIYQQLASKNRNSLSDGQQDWFGKLESKYSLASQKEGQEWIMNFSTDMRITALQIARYYEANPPYFSHYLHKIFKDPAGFVLTKREWDKFCENKYAKKIRNIYFMPIFKQLSNILILI